MEYEFTSKESAIRLLGYGADFSDDIEDIVNEIPTIEKAIELLRESGGELEILSFAIDRILMNDAFENSGDWLKREMIE